MVTSVSSLTSTQTQSSSGTTSAAALQKQLASKEAELDKASDDAAKAKLNNEIAALKAKLAALEAAETEKNKKADEPVDPQAAARQAEFDADSLSLASRSLRI